MISWPPDRDRNCLLDLFRSAAWDVHHRHTGRHPAVYVPRCGMARPPGTYGVGRDPHVWRGDCHQLGFELDGCGALGGAEVYRASLKLAVDAGDRPVVPYDRLNRGDE